MSTFSILKGLFKKRVETKEGFKSDIKLKTIISLILSGGALLLTIFNYAVGETLMMYTTIALTGVFLICAFLIGVFKLRFVGQILMALGIGAVFSYYALTAQNQGFAILWIVLVPTVSMLFLSFELGFALSIYFLLFIVTFFYIGPAKAWMMTLWDTSKNNMYNDTFMLRFPALYLIALIASIILVAQKIYYSNKSEVNSLYDSMTSLKNRRYYSDYLLELENSNDLGKLVVVSIDLNNLKVLNDLYGHDVGDEAIIKAGDVLSKKFAKYTDHVYRTGGDEFIIFFNDNDGAIERLVSEIKQEANDAVIKDDKRLSLSIGWVSAAEHTDMNINLLVSLAERNMYKDKEEYYKNYYGERRRENIFKNMEEK